MLFEKELVQLLHLLDVAKETGHCVFVNTLAPGVAGPQTLSMQISNENVDRFRCILLNELMAIYEGSE